ncbi:hypothetical protein GCM10008022_19020 [Paenibacillus hunanensis]|nr:hypothetical protein GCM10008022_19020 [Paenibacillus hunanensis]
MLLKGMSFCHTGGWEFGYSWWGFGIVQMWWLEFELNLLGMEWCDGYGYTTPSRNKGTDSDGAAGIFWNGEEMKIPAPPKQ